MAIVQDEAIAKMVPAAHALNAVKPVVVGANGAELETFARVAQAVMVVDVHKRLRSRLIIEMPCLPPLIQRSLRLQNSSFAAVFRQFVKQSKSRTHKRRLKVALRQRKTPS